MGRAYLGHRDYSQKAASKKWVENMQKAYGKNYQNRPKSRSSKSGMCWTNTLLK